jgi:hypothetical protein
MLILLSAAVAPLALAGCYEEGYGYGGGVAAGYGYGAPYAYNGWYDDYYGPFYDGYWGGDGFFYYRSSVNDRDFRRGDPNHFRRAPGGGDHFHEMHGSFTPNRSMHTPHFNGGERHRQG